MRHDVDRRRCGTPVRKPSRDLEGAGRGRSQVSERDIRRLRSAGDDRVRIRERGLGLRSRDAVAGHARIRADDALSALELFDGRLRQRAEVASRAPGKIPFRDKLFLESRDVRAGHAERQGTCRGKRRRHGERHEEHYCRNDRQDPRDQAFHHMRRIIPRSGFSFSSELRSLAWG